MSAAEYDPALSPKAWGAPNADLLRPTRTTHQSLASATPIGPTQLLGQLFVKTNNAFHFFQNTLASSSDSRLRPLVRTNFLPQGIFKEEPLLLDEFEAVLDLRRISRRCTEFGQ